MNLGELAAPFLLRRVDVSSDIMSMHCTSAWAGSASLPVARKQEQTLVMNGKTEDSLQDEISQASDLCAGDQGVENGIDLPHNSPSK